MGLIAVGMASYYASMLLVAAQLNHFRRNAENPCRLRSLCWTPYFTDGILAAVAGLLNPAGLFYVIASALPSTLGANAGLLSLPSTTGRIKAGNSEPVHPVQRNVARIATGAIASLLFIFVLGRGITWTW